MANIVIIIITEAAGLQRKVQTDTHTVYVQTAIIFTPDHFVSIRNQLISVHFITFLKSYVESIERRQERETQMRRKQMEREGALQSSRDMNSEHEHCYARNKTDGC